MARRFSICLFPCYSSFSVFLSVFRVMENWSPEEDGGAAVEFIILRRQVGSEKACVPLHLSPSHFFFVHFLFSLLFLCLSDCVGDEDESPAGSTWEAQCWTEEYRSCPILAAFLRLPAQRLAVDPQITHSMTYTRTFVWLSLWGPTFISSMNFDWI